MSGELGAEALEALQGADHMGTCSFQSILGHVGTCSFQPVTMGHLGTHLVQPVSVKEMG